jgi:GT2 family glycosyltransferase
VPEAAPLPCPAENRARIEDRLRLAGSSQRRIGRRTDHLGRPDICRSPARVELDPRLNPSWPVPMPIAEPIDIVIPVYNAPELTRACIESLYTHVERQIGTVHVHDNASGAETACMLDALRYPRLSVVHARKNTGFGDAVNQAVARCKADLVLVLNSDTYAGDDFIAPLRAAMQADDRLAAVTSAGNTFASYDLGRYRHRAGCVVTHNLYAYAFLIRRSVFSSVGGFDRAYGLGYYEDSQLSRRLIEAGFWIGIQPESVLHHEIHGSFQHDPNMRALMQRNRELYYERFPDARRRLLLISREGSPEALPRPLLADVEHVLERGGEVDWLAAEPPRDLLSLSMRGEVYGTLRALRHWQRRRKHPYKRLTDLWMVDGAPGEALGIAHLARRAGLRIRTFARAYRS